MQEEAKARRLALSLITPESVWELQKALYAKAKNEEPPQRLPLVCESMNTLERKLDARNGHVRFDERGLINLFVDTFGRLQLICADGGYLGALVHWVKQLRRFGKLRLERRS